MANTIITPSIIAKEALMQLENNLVMGNLVHRDYGGEFDKVGSTISIRKPVKFQAQDGATRVNQDVTEGTTSITMDQRKHVSWKFTTNDLTLSIEEYSDRYIKPAAIELAQTVEGALCNLYATVPDHVGTPGTPPANFLAMGAAWQRLAENAAPQGETINAVLNPAASLLIANDVRQVYVQDKAKTALERVKIGNYAGMDTYMAQSIVNHTVGPLGGTPLVNGANQHSNTTPQANTQSLITKGWTAAAAARLAAGDVFTIANVFNVNPKTRQSTGVLKCFTVVSAVSSDAGGNATITISPAIVTTGAFQNVSAAPADNAPLTIRTGTASTAYAQNLAFQKNAFALVMSDLVMPDGAAFKARERYKGLSMRVVKDYNIDSDEEIIRLDILYGVKTIYPELACRITG